MKCGEVSFGAPRGPINLMFTLMVWVLYIVIEMMNGQYKNDFLAHLSKLVEPFFNFVNGSSLAQFGFGAMKTCGFFFEFGKMKDRGKA